MQHDQEGPSLSCMDVNMILQQDDHQGKCLQVNGVGLARVSSPAFQQQQQHDGLPQATMAGGSELDRPLQSMPVTKPAAPLSTRPMLEPKSSPSTPLGTSPLPLSEVAPPLTPPSDEDDYPSRDRTPVVVDAPSPQAPLRAKKGLPYGGPHIQPDVHEEAAAAAAVAAAVLAASGPTPGPDMPSATDHSANPARRDGPISPNPPTPQFRPHGPPPLETPQFVMGQSDRRRRLTGSPRQSPKPYGKSVQGFSDRATRPRIHIPSQPDEDADGGRGSAAPNGLDDSAEGPVIRQGRLPHSSSKGQQEQGSGLEEEISPNPGRVKLHQQLSPNIVSESGGPPVSL